MGVTENVGFNAKVQRITGICPWLDRLLSYLLVKKAMVHLQKHKAYIFLYCMSIEVLCSAGARLLLLVGHLGCEGGTRREREPPGMGQSPQWGQCPWSWSWGRTFAMADPYGGGWYSG